MGCLSGSTTLLAHSQDFVAVSFQPVEEGIDLRLAVDSLNQPKVADAAQALEVLRACLQVHSVAGEPLSLQRAGELRLQDGPDWTQCLPSSLQRDGDDQPHGYVTASWHYRGREPLRFSVPKVPGLDVLLWTQDARGEVISTLLLPGEGSPKIHPLPSTNLSLPAWLGLGALVGALGSAMAWRWRRT